MTLPRVHLLQLLAAKVNGRDRRDSMQSVGNETGSGRLGTIQLKPRWLRLGLTRN